MINSKHKISECAPFVFSANNPLETGKQIGPRKWGEKPLIYRRILSALGVKMRSTGFVWVERAGSVQNTWKFLSPFDNHYVKLTYWLILSCPTVLAEDVAFFSGECCGAEKRVHKFN